MLAWSIHISNIIAIILIVFGVLMPRDNIFNVEDAYEIY